MKRRGKRYRVLRRVRVVKSVMVIQLALIKLLGNGAPSNSEGDTDSGGRRGVYILAGEGRGGVTWRDTWHVNLLLVTPSR